MNCLSMRRVCCFTSLLLTDGSKGEWGGGDGYLCLIRYLMLGST